MVDTVVKGIPEMQKRILNLIRALPAEIDRAMIAEASDVLKVAKERTPVDTGDLKDSGKIVALTTSGNGHTVSYEIQFGGEVAYYAIYVHENMQAKHPNGGQAKFLESAVLESIPGMSTRIGRRIQIERLAR